MELQEEKTTRVHVDRIEHYATPLLRVKNAQKLQSPKDYVMPLLRRAERQLQKKPDLAEIYNKEPDVADPDPITPNLLLMGRKDASLPQAVYAGTGFICKR